MTKKWSSTKSMDGQTKRQASHLTRGEKALLLRDELEKARELCLDIVPEDIITWLNDEPR